MRIIPAVFLEALEDQQLPGDVPGVASDSDFCEGEFWADSQSEGRLPDTTAHQIKRATAKPIDLLAGLVKPSSLSPLPQILSKATEEV